MAIKRKTTKKKSGAIVMTHSSASASAAALVNLFVKVDFSKNVKDVDLKLGIHIYFNKGNTYKPGW